MPLLLPETMLVILPKNCASDAGRRTNCWEAERITSLLSWTRQRHSLHSAPTRDKQHKEKVVAVAESGTSGVRQLLSNPKAGSSSGCCRGGKPCDLLKGANEPVSRAL